MEHALTDRSTRPLLDLQAFYNETKSPGILEISGVFFQANVNGTVPSGSHKGAKARGMEMRPESVHKPSRNLRSHFLF